MLKQLIMACALTGALLLEGCSIVPPKTYEISLIPEPNEVLQTNNEFILQYGCTIGVTDKQLLPAAGYLAGLLSGSTGYTYNIKEGEGTISLAIADIPGNEGSYSLDVTPEGIQIKGNSYSGVIAGIQTLRQLLPQEIELAEVLAGIDWKVPGVRIIDSPHFEWRGVMLDVSRHFYTKKEVKEFLDLMALYKLNKFHWRLTDDQGWRIEIKQYPLLTEKGAWRTFNTFDRNCMALAGEQDNSDFEIPEDRLQIVQGGDTLYGGFYTQDDIKEIVEYAGIRGIDVIPEIDMPGQMQAAVGNYSGISCFRETGSGETYSSPVCPGKETALQFCKNLYSEILPLFPYKYVHIGTDELRKDNWKKCPDCQKRMKMEGLKTEEELQAWFIRELEKYLNENGKLPVDWTGILTFDVRQEMNTPRRVYNYNLTSDSSGEAQKPLILGVQANLQSEWMPSRERMHYMAMPRMMALAELAWSDPANMDWEGFTKRMAVQFPRLHILNINYRIPDLEGFHAVNAFVGEGTVDIVCADPSAEIRYTTDGSIPTLESQKYTVPLDITETTDFAFRTFRPNGKKGDIVKTRFIKSEYTPAVAVATPAHNGLKAVWYAFVGENCAGIDSGVVNGTYEIDDVLVPPDAKGNIGLIISGYLNAPEDGIYTFALSSDDGSLLTIAGDVVVDNDGLHSSREISGQKALAKGLHPIEVRYFDRNGGMLHLKVIGPDGKVLPVGSGIYAWN